MKALLITLFLLVLLIADAMLYESVHSLNQNLLKKEGDLQIQLGELEMKMPEGSVNKPADLSVIMNLSEAYTLKLNLAINENNAKLITYYLEKLEQMGSRLQNSAEDSGDPAYKNLWQQSVAQEIGVLKDLADLGETTSLQEGIQNLVQSCNVCHAKTNVAFLKFELPKTASKEAAFSLQNFKAVP